MIVLNFLGRFFVMYLFPTDHRERYQTFLERANTWHFVKTGNHDRLTTDAEIEKHCREEALKIWSAKDET